MRRTVLMAISALLMFCSVSFAQGVTLSQAMQVNFPKDIIQVSTGNSAGEAVELKVEVAANPLQRQVGLMFRDEVPDKTGMLFLFSQEQPLAFWMKNTYVPLDMFFINKTGTIVSIATAKPLDETHVPSGAPAMAVLEMVAGSAQKYGIQVGDKVFYRAFSNK